MNYKKQLRDFIDIINPQLNRINDLNYIDYDGDIITSKGWCDYFCGYKIANSDHSNNEFHCPYGNNCDITEDSYEFVSLETRDDYLYLCGKILDASLDWTIASAKAHDYIVYLERYTLKFAQVLKQEWECFKNVSLQDAPIRITSLNPRDNNGYVPEEESELAGHYTEDYGITVFCADPSQKESNECTCRHEVIHFMLRKALLPYLDDDPEFWFFADLYDANPYKPLNNNGIELYNIYKTLYNDLKLKTLNALFLPRHSIYYKREIEKRRILEEAYEETIDLLKEYSNDPKFKGALALILESE